MKKIEIKGKEYVPVNERILYFRSHYEGWRIITEIVSLEQQFVLMKASVIDTEGVTIATAHAYEKENSSFINKTSYIENCETSAVGRVLGLLGIGIDTSIASFEEVANAITQQSKAVKPKATTEQMNRILEVVKKGILTSEDITAEIEGVYGKKAFKDLTWEEAEKLTEKVERLGK